MERLKAARFVNNFSRALPEPEPKAAPPPVVEAQLPTNANIGNLGTSNAVLGDSDGPYLHITMTSLGNSALLDALSVGVHRLAELRHVVLTTPSKRETTIDRLPLKVSMNEDEDWQSLVEAANNPTQWYRQPFVMVVLICAETIEDYKNKHRKRLLILRDKLAALPAGVATRMTIACVRSATTQSPDTFRKVHAKVQDDFHRTDRVLRLDAGIEHMQSARGSRDWDTLKQMLVLRFSEAFEQRMEAFGEELRSLRTGLDGSTAHLAHNLLVKDALATMLARARLFGDAGLELTFMDISYEHHATRHPEMHVFSVNLEADLNPSLADMRQEYLRRMLVQDGRMNTFVMRQYLFGARLKLMLATVRESGLSGDTLSCAQQALIFLSTARAKLHALQREGGVPYLFPECWICLAALGIAAVLSDTLCAAAAVAAATSEAASEAAAAAATTGSGSEAAAAAAAMDLAAALAEDGALPVRGGGKAADGAVSAAAALQEVMPFAVSVPKLIAAFKDGEAMARPAAAVVSGAQDVAPQPNAAEQRMIVKKMQLTLAQVLASAYMAAVEVSQSLALACPLHPEVDDVAPLCSWLVGAKGDTPAPEASPRTHEGSSERQPLSLSVQLFTTSLQGQLREAEIIMPYELMHVAGSGSVPSWLSQSTLSPFVSDALQLERLLRALASTAAWHFSHAGAPRHASCLASLAASYFFRMDEPEPAAKLWLAAVAPLLQQGWRRAAVKVLDRLLAAGCLLRSDVTAAAAVQLLSTPAPILEAAFPGDDTLPRLMHACALRALQHFCPASEIALQEVLFVDISKSQASRFYEEVQGGQGGARGEGAGRQALLRPPACSDGETNAAQLVGLADHATMRVCITSRLPVPVKVTGLTLQLQHAIHAARAAPDADSPAALAAGAGSSVAGAPSSAALNPASPSGTAHDGTPVPTPRDNTPAAAADDRSSSAPSRSGYLRRRSTWLNGTPRGGPRGGGSVSGAAPPRPAAPYAASLLSDAHVPGAAQVAVDGDTPHDGSPAWQAGYVLNCPLESDDGEAVSLRPGDNHLLFSACPLQEGLHLLDCAYGTLECPAQHSLLIEARHGSSVAGGGFAEDEPLGAALVARADEDSLAVHSVIPGGMLLESQSQWLGVQLAPARGEVRDVTMRVALRAVDRAAPLEYAHVARSAAEAAAAASAADGAAGVGPDVALWQRRGSGNAEVVRCIDGEVTLAGPLAQGGTLWLPVHCRQQHQLVQLVDIGAGAMLTEDKGERAPVDTLDALTEVALSYWSGCWRSKHIRLQLPVQRTISTTVAAQSISPSEVAVQVSQASLCPCTLTITALQLHLQGGLSCSGREIAGMQPPFPLPPNSAQSFLFFVDHAAAAAASRAALQSCALLSDYVIPRRDLQQLALVTLNPAGKAVPDSGPGAAVPIATPRESGTLPAALVDMVLHAPHAVTSPLEQKAAAQVAKAGATGAAVSLQGSLEEGTAVAAMCTNSHAFRLELPSFSVSNPPTSDGRSDAQGAGPMPEPPVIHFIGPHRGTAGRPVLLVWKVGWASDGNGDDALGLEAEGSPHSHTLQYEVLMPGGWQRGRKQKGIIKLGAASSAFATVAVSAVPTAGGQITSPTLIVLPPDRQPVRGGSVWMHVEEAA